MTKVKICGIKTAEEVSILNRHVPDYAGFIFSKSKRIVSSKMADFLIKLLPEEVKKVGVFVNEPLEKVLDIQWGCTLDVVQLSGEEDQSYIDALKKSGYVKEIWKSVRIKDGSELLNNIHSDAILLDSYSEKAHGGTGETFDWNIAKSFAEGKRIILAGGLKHGNVRNAIDILRPFCVDVSSGVEVNGYKDEYLVSKFINAVKTGVDI
jgi:Phosphoribosylanthranilate isomerase